MPFPVLNKTDFSRTDIFLLPTDYFHPIINDEFHETLLVSAQRGTMTLSTAMTIAQNLLCDESLEDVLHYIAQHNCGGRATAILSVLRTVYNELPEDKKWLLFYTKLSFGGETNTGAVTYSVSFRYPYRVSYNESYCDTITVPASLHLTYNTAGVLDVVAASLEPFRQSLSTAIIAASNHFEQHSGSVISWTDSMAPSLVGLTYRYAVGASLFYPDGDQYNFPVHFDWASPAVIRNYIRDGIGITLKLNNTGTKITFSARHKPGDRRMIERVLNYSANVFDYLPYTIKGPKEPAAVLYGVELEANGDYTPKELIAAQKDLFFIMKQDGSIHGSKTQNYELVTVPASLKAHKRLWAEFFEKIDYQKFDTSKDTGNGMHVHIDRKAFKNSHLNRFTWFITNPANEDFILAISERPTKRNLEEWARMPNHFAHASKLKAARLASRTNDGLRGAVHFKRDKTVEVRLFKGIVSYATVIKNLEFVDSVFHYTQQTVLSQLSLKHYLAWLAETPKNKYQLLKAFLAESKTPDYIAASEVVDLVWSLKTEHLVAEKLNKAPFKVSNVHVTYLNKKRRKRTFVLKGGKVECIASSGGLLAKLDKSVQQKQTRGAATFAMTNFAA